MPKRKRARKVRSHTQPLSAINRGVLRTGKETKTADVVRVCRLKGEYHYEGQLIQNSFQCYVFYLDKKAVRGKNGDWVKVDQKCVSTDWHKIAPKELHLEPGGGPIRIKIVRAK